MTVSLRIEAFDLSDNGWQFRLPEQRFTLPPNSSTELRAKMPIPQPPVEIASDKTAPSSSVVIHATLIDNNGDCLARTTDFPMPYRFLTIPDPKIKIDTAGDHVAISVERPVKGLILRLLDQDDGGEEVQFSDNNVRYVRISRSSVS